MKTTNVEVNPQKLETSASSLQAQTACLSAPAEQVLSGLLGMGLQVVQKCSDLELQGRCENKSTEATARLSQKSLVQAAVTILKEPDAQRKAEETRLLAQQWTQRQLPVGDNIHLHVPDRPGRADDKVKVVAPGKVPSLGKGGSLASRQAILHSLVHIESWAVDLSWDAVARFSQDPQYSLPDAFMNDFVQVAADEAKHFQQLQQRLEAIGSFYGAFPVHDGLWESAEATAHSLPARLAVESCVHEARGLDRLPHTIQRFRSRGDLESAKLLEQIYQEEIAHCAAGVRWLTYLHKQAIASSNAHSNSITQPVCTLSAADGNTLQTSEPDMGSCERGQKVPQISTSKSTGFESCHGDTSWPERAGKGSACDDTRPINGNSTVQTLSENQHQHAEADDQPLDNGDSTVQNLSESQHQQAADDGQPRGSSKPYPSASDNGRAAVMHAWQVEAVNYDTVEQWFHALVRAHFKGSLKPPFNEAARAAAGFGPEWYLPLASEVLKSSPLSKKQLHTSILILRTFL